MKFNEICREFRESKGMTQIDIAKSLEISRQCVSQFEKGEIKTKKILNYLISLGLIDYVNEHYMANLTANNANELLADVEYLHNNTIERRI